MLTYLYNAYLITVKSVHFMSPSKYLLYSKYIRVCVHVCVGRERMGVCVCVCTHMVFVKVFTKNNFENKKGNCRNI